MCFTVVPAYTCSRRYCNPEPAIIWPMQPRKLMSVWNPPNCKMISWNSLPSGWLSITSSDFNQRGWSNVIIGFTLYWRAWLQMNCRVEKMQVRLPGSISIIGRNNIDAGPGCGPLCTACIIPDHAGRGERRWSDMFHRLSSASQSLSWYSSILSFWYLRFWSRTGHRHVVDVDTSDS